MQELYKCIVCKARFLDNREDTYVFEYLENGETKTGFLCSNKCRDTRFKEIEV